MLSDSRSTAAPGGRTSQELRVPTAQAEKWPHQQDTVPQHLGKAGWRQPRVPLTAQASPDHSRQ